MSMIFDDALLGSKVKVKVNVTVRRGAVVAVAGRRRGFETGGIGHGNIGIRGR